MAQNPFNVPDLAIRESFAIKIQDFASNPQFPAISNNACFVWNTHSCLEI